MSGQRPSPWHDPAGWHRSIDEQVRAESEAVESVACLLCSATHPGDRLAARGARWESYSHATQWQVDHGPMVCPECVAAAIGRALVAAKEAFGRRPAAHCPDWPLCGHEGGACQP